MIKLSQLSESQTLMSWKAKSYNSTIKLQMYYKKIIKNSQSVLFVDKKRG